MAFRGEGPSHAVLPLGFRDVSRPHKYDAEIFGTWTATGCWKISRGISAIQLATSNHDGGVSVLESVDSTPRFQAQLRSSVDLTKHLNWNVTAWHIGRWIYPANNTAVLRSPENLPEHLHGPPIGARLTVRPEFRHEMRSEKTGG